MRRRLRIMLYSPILSCLFAVVLCPRLPYGRYIEEDPFKAVRSQQYRQFQQFQRLSMSDSRISYSLFDNVQPKPPNACTKECCMKLAAIRKAEEQLENNIESEIRRFRTEGVKELQTLFEGVFAVFDLDGDNIVSFDEFSKVLKMKGIGRSDGNQTNSSKRNQTSRKESRNENSLRKDQTIETIRTDQSIQTIQSGQFTSRRQYTREFLTGKSDQTSIANPLRLMKERTFQRGRTADELKRLRIWRKRKEWLNRKRKERRKRRKLRRKMRRGRRRKRKRRGKLRRKKNKRPLLT